MFSRITHSLRGQPLTSYEVLLQTISATRTSTGLSVSAVLDENNYPTGRKLTRAERKAVEQRVERDEFHGEWNYTIAPHDPVQDPPTSPEQKLAAPIPPEATFLLTHPALTGMSRDQFDQLVDQLEFPDSVRRAEEFLGAAKPQHGRHHSAGQAGHGTAPFLGCSVYFGDRSGRCSSSWGGLPDGLELLCGSMGKHHDRATSYWPAFPGGFPL
ncbi:hypothetical protein [Streptomyces sp. P8-A8]|uniref:ISAzo13-like element transposase-related protein n=1 Tax=Streptomyces sp. P8-A8 TaxID=3029759 RepID=UPI0036DA3BCB